MNGVQVAWRAETAGAFAIRKAHDGTDVCAVLSDDVRNTERYGR